MLAVGTDRDQRRFDCEGVFLGGPGGQGGFSIAAKTDDKSPWKNALGVQGLSLHSAGLEMRSETAAGAPPQLLIGVRGDVQLAKKWVGVAGGVSRRKGLPSVFLKGSLDSLNRDDLVAIANDLATDSHGGIDSPVVGTMLPDFELRQVAFVYAPAGGSEELGVPSGIGLKGQLFLSGKHAALVEGLVDVSGRTPMTLIKADVEEFAIGPVVLHETKLDLLLGARADRPRQSRKRNRQRRQRG